MRFGGVKRYFSARVIDCFKREQETAGAKMTVFLINLMRVGANSFPMAFLHQTSVGFIFLNLSLQYASQQIQCFVDNLWLVEIGYDNSCGQSTKKHDRQPSGQV